MSPNISPNISPTGKGKPILIQGLSLGNLNDDKKEKEEYKRIYTPRDSFDEYSDDPYSNVV